MIVTDFSNNAQSTQQKNIEGKRLYSPGVIAGYCIFIMTIGLVLYGLNLGRRGKAWNGRLLIMLSIVIACQTVVSDFLPGKNIGGGVLSMLPIFVALELYKKEQIPYEKAISHGAVTAKWWPPLLWLLIALLAISVMLFIIQPVSLPRDVPQERHCLLEAISLR
jgi:hypothetical protein